MNSLGFILPNTGPFGPVALTKGGLNLAKIKLSTCNTNAIQCSDLLRIYIIEMDNLDTNLLNAEAVGVAAFDENST
jgi:hypothetical protein